MPRSRFFLLLALALSAAPLASAQSRPTLVASQPVQGGVVTSPVSMDLTLSEPVPAGALTVALVMTAMPGMPSHKPMVIRGFGIEAQDEHVTLRFPRPLPAGTYRLTWQVAGEPSGPPGDALTFRVK